MLQFQILRVISDSKMNLVGVLGGHFLNFPIVSKRAGKNQKKIKEKTAKSICLYGCSSKANLCKYLKFSPNFYVSVIYIQLNFQKFLTF
ncbi:Uncharacterized protein FWK35_00019992 [Aphis craccivora]|uniref:Uncharacterized protein n=1 Tax=Aphis craccivora TaxID=307492 RepID=A0A6G0YTX3_APHCR|nr:Uncharacterized protein FWK35_00019992 [Aphis craccivora]